jgi:double-strand break repair protein MRE11
LYRVSVLTQAERDKIEKNKPGEEILASLAADNVKVDKLVKEYLTAQSLKILPKAPFGDAVTQFVDKDDKHAMESFVNESLSAQVKEMLAMDEESSDQDLDSIMERLRQKQEEQFAAGILTRPKRKGKLRPRPTNWDSDLDGDWEDAPGAYEMSDREEGAVGSGSDDDTSLASAPVKKAPAKKAPAKKAPAKPRAPAKAKVPVKAPAKTTARRRNKVLEPSDDEDDVVMVDDDHPPVKSQPQRASRTRQTQLAFSQTPKTQTAMELSDDEISDDDAFEPMATSSRRR